MGILDNIDFLVDDPKNKVNLTFLKNSVERGNISHAYLFSGGDIDKLYRLSQYFSASVNCPGKGCGDCKVCKDTLKGVYPDVITVEADGSILTIDKIVELQNFMSLTSYNPGRKIGIIKDADILNEEASNRLLKTLEEPPHPGSIFILLSEDTKSILPTVLSRCLILEWNLEPDRKEIEKTYFAELEAHVNEGIRNLICISRNSSHRDFSHSLNLSVKFVDFLKEITNRVKEDLEKEIKEIEKSSVDRSAADKYTKPIKARNERRLKKISNLGVNKVFDIISAWLEDICMVRLNFEASKLNYEQNYALINESFEDVEIDRVLKLSELIQRNREHLIYSISSELSLDNILVQFQNLIKPIKPEV